jgi:TAG lipase / steryl ester hydrolase / phospholipase A2 / LPA acyltransferase
MSEVRWPARRAVPGSYEEWKRAAVARDEASGRSRWRESEESRFYDHATVKARLQQLKVLLAADDDRDLLAALDDGMHGNLAGMGNPELYAGAESGTKILITDYIDAVCSGLRRLAASPDRVIPEPEKRRFLQRASVGFGASALLLSGGGVYGNFHVGVVRVLIEHDLLPKVISGSSAGALIAAMVGTYLPGELSGAFDESNLAIETQRDPSRVRSAVKGLIPRFDLQEVERHIERLVPDLTFAEAFERTGIRVNVSVSPADLHQSPRLLNAATTPNVLVRSAVMASCSIPGVFPAAMLVARGDDGKPRPYLPERRWYDGSVTEDIPARRLSRLYGVNHSIVSQVNPLALALVRPTKDRSLLTAPLYQFWHQSSLGMARGLQRLLSHHGGRWPEVNVAINGLVSILSQEYSGDITILPELGLVKPWRGMKALDETQLRALVAAGERATWPKVEMIRNCTNIGRLLDQLLAAARPAPVPASTSARASAGARTRRTRPAISGLSRSFNEG